MPEEFSESDMERLNALFAENMHWANQAVTLEEVAKANKSLVRDLARYDPAVAVPLLASLLTVPEYQSNCIRLEILVALAVVHCRGRKKANIAEAIRWFSLIGQSKCVSGEDPAEDVFVSLVYDSNGDYRLIEGIWESAGFYTQRVLDVMATMPDTGRYWEIKRSIRALLIISDMVCEKSGLQRYQLGSEELHSVLSSRMLPRRNALISRVKISFAELEEHGISFDDIKPFILHPQIRKELPAQEVKLSLLNRCPLIAHDAKHLTVALPTALSVAVRDYVIEHIIRLGFSSSFDEVLAQKYSELFFDTPLLGRMNQAPVYWMQLDGCKLSNFVVRIDEGYFISFHLVLPSVQTHLNGGFKGYYQDEGSIGELLQSQLNDVVEKFRNQEGFKSGLIVLVGCGWGRGYGIPGASLNHPHWRFQSMSAADLVRLSWLADMKPGYFWRIQDGLETIEKAGVKIFNLNGILNLIGWIRKNDGHFVPHAQLPEGEISPERPLRLCPPLNLLREVRADSDQGYDRHCMADNTGKWHIVQHESPNPFFSNETSRRVYVSLDDMLQRKNITALYEGSLKLWFSVAAPGISNNGHRYQLWEMAREWLPRIGNALDKRTEFLSVKHPLKVYIEFIGNDPEDGWTEKPSIDELVPLCRIEFHSEPNACKAVFQTTILDGCRIAENVVERLFVRTLTQAYLHILGAKDCECEAEEIEHLVVPNDDARSLHFFQAREFIDFVRDTLPKKVIEIDPVDDAAVKIGLGWRVLEKGQDNTIKGKETCTRFLGKVVDVLLADTFEALKPFNRLAVLNRLVANCEKANAEKRQWKQTSAALLGLYGNEQGTVERYVEQMDKFAGANLASRILIEIALCVCPVEGGAKISDIELSKLIARAALLARIGGLSDAIYYNALPPELTISPLGDILFQNEFGQAVVKPMLTRHTGDGFIANAPLQKKNYEEPEIYPEAQKGLNGDFLEAWKIEMGFEIDEARSVIDVLEDKGIKDNAAIFTMKQSEYLKLLSSEGVSEDVAGKFLDQFSLSPRPRWDKLPKGFSLKDIYPWRYGRRLSFVTRPFLKTDDSDDPLLIIAPNALRIGFVYVFDGAYNGNFEQDFFRTTEMRDAWWGKAREGHTFNAEVAKKLQQAGWHVHENIGLPELLNRKDRKIEGDFGDVDVLAWRTGHKDILVIECKDLSLARNYSEIAALLSEYQGSTDSNGKRDKLKRHLDRVALLQENLDKIQRFTEVSEPNIVSCLVCSGIVPMQYAKIDALANTRVGSIEEILTRYPFCKTS
uniref:anti-phage protein Upx n=1 Tax=Candidatus Electronema sp. TaxID=2698783 RepID=UPI0040576F4A